MRDQRAGYLFLLPALTTFLLFVGYPFVGSFWYSLTSWNGVSPHKQWVGLANYRRMFSDPLVWESLRHNLVWVVLGTIVPAALALFLAVLVAGAPRLRTFFRAALFVPAVISSVAVGVIWTWMYDPLFGAINTTLRDIGLGSLAQGWLADSNIALVSIIVAGIWAYTGLVFVIFLAGLQGIDTTLMDAAAMDGANDLQTFYHVTLPGLRHVITVVVLLGLVGGFAVFDLVFVMTQGGPANSTELIATYAYRKAFMENDVGYASALTVLMTAIALATGAVFVKVRSRD